jgi:steroid 5-alpha reductase family enzyme
MSGDWWRIAGGAVAFVLEFVTGFWLARSGKPYGTALLTVHKLTAVGMLVVLVVTASRASKAAPLGAGVWLGVALAIVAFVALIGSGGALSAMASPPPAVSLLHKVAPYVTVLLTAVAFFLLRARF